MKIQYANLLLIGILLSAGCASAKKEAVVEQPFEQKPAVITQTKAVNLRLAPDFKLQDLNRKTFTLNSYKDKQPVILIFWTTWCPYCREQLKQLNERLPELTKKGIEILAIDVGEPRNKVENFAKSHSLNLQILLDEDNTVSDAYELMGVPTYFVIDLSGQVVSAANQFPEDAINKLAVK